MERTMATNGMNGWFDDLPELDEEIDPVALLNALHDDEDPNWHEQQHQAFKLQLVLTNQQILANHIAQQFDGINQNLARITVQPPPIAPPPEPEPTPTPPPPAPPPTPQPHQPCQPIAPHPQQQRPQLLPPMHCMPMCCMQQQNWNPHLGTNMHGCCCNKHWNCCVQKATTGKRGKPPHDWNCRNRNKNNNSIT